MITIKCRSHKVVIKDDTKKPVKSIPLTKRFKSAIEFLAYIKKTMGVTMDNIIKQGGEFLS
jgi:hypothetical protein